MATFRIQRLYAMSYPDVYILIGIPGSGKSTWCREERPEHPVVSKDVIREQLGFAMPGQKMIGTPEQEAQVTAEQERQIHDLTFDKHEFILDDTNLNPSTLMPIMGDLKRKGYNLIAVVFDTPYIECLQRRHSQISSTVMRGFYDSFKKLNPEALGFDKIIHVL